MPGTSTPFLALLRGLNVGGQNVIGQHDVIFWSISKQHQTRTTWMKLAAAPVYQHLTVRNHRTVFRLRELLEEL